MIKERGFSDDDRRQLDSLRSKALVGTAEQVAEGMRALAAQLGLQELVVNTWAHEPVVRRRSYDLLARAFSLPQKTKPL